MNPETQSTAMKEARKVVTTTTKVLIFIVVVTILVVVAVAVVVVMFTVMDVGATFVVGLNDWI